MPIKLPENVKISPKAIKTEWWISPKGGQMKPAVSIMHPKVHSATEIASWSFLIFIRKLKGPFYKFNILEEAPLWLIV